jgi:hypothetical protein
MIKNFEQQTSKLSEEELRIAEIIKKPLSRRKGKFYAIAGTKICSGINNNTDHRLSSVRLRKIINYLRNQGEPICSNSKGYFYPENKQEILDTITSIQQRIDSQKQIINQLNKHI